MLTVRSMHGQDPEADLAHTWNRPPGTDALGIDGLA